MEVTLAAVAIGVAALLIMALFARRVASDRQNRADGGVILFPDGAGGPSSEHEGSTGDPGCDVGSDGGGCGDAGGDGGGGGD